MRALSIRQPFAELILRGVKTCEYRSRATSIIGERFYIYASKTKMKDDAGRMSGFWSSDLSDPNLLPSWMVEIAEQLKVIPPGTELPTGVIVGSAVIERVEEVASCELLVASQEKRERFSPATHSPQRATRLYRWHLSQVEREKVFRKPIGHPQPVWFKPF